MSDMNIVVGILIAIPSGILGGVVAGLLQSWLPWLLPPNRRSDDE